MSTWTDGNLNWDKPDPNVGEYWKILESAAIERIDFIGMPSTLYQKSSFDTLTNLRPGPRLDGQYVITQKLLEFPGLTGYYRDITTPLKALNLTDTLYFPPNVNTSSASLITYTDPTKGNRNTFTYFDNLAGKNLANLWVNRRKMDYLAASNYLKRAAIFLKQMVYYPIRQQTKPDGYYCSHQKYYTTFGSWSSDHLTAYNNMVKEELEWNTSVAFFGPTASFGLEAYFGDGGLAHWSSEASSMYKRAWKFKLPALGYPTDYTYTLREYSYRKDEFVYTNLGTYQYPDLKYYSDLPYVLDSDQNRIEAELISSDALLSPEGQEICSGSCGAGEIKTTVIGELNDVEDSRLRSYFQNGPEYKESGTWPTIYRRGSISFARRPTQLLCFAKPNFQYPSEE